MHDARTQVALGIEWIRAGTFEAASSEQRVDERSIGMSFGRVHDKARGFVHDQEMFVFVNDIDLDRSIRFRLRWLGSFWLHIHMRANGHGRCRLLALPIDEHASAYDPSLHFTT
jgi:hypothetical protein